MTDIEVNNHQAIAEDALDDTSRKLATVSTIRSVLPVPDSDRLDVVTLTTNGWSIVMGRNETKPGDRIVFFEIDSFLPKEDRYAILEGRCNKTLKGKEGYRIKTIKLRGQVSQGFAMPLSSFKEIPQDAEDATDVTKELNVQLWLLPVQGGGYNISSS